MTVRCRAAPEPGSGPGNEPDWRNAVTASATQPAGCETDHMFNDITTIIFLILAVVIFFRLRSVLGRRTGNERPPFDP